MSRIGSRQRRDEYLLADLDDLLRPARRLVVAGAVWRWRYELAFAALAAALVAFFVRLLGAEGAALALSAALGVASPWPPAHRALAARAWWLITPHRLRVGFAQARIETRSGRLPAIVRTTCQPFGERVCVWCPAGTSAEDLRSAQAILRTACWAPDLRISTHPRHPQIVIVDVIRRRRQPAASRAGRRRA